MGSHYKIRTEKTGHFFMHGTLTDQTEYVWICLHGYGGLGKYFIRHFEFLDPVKNLVIVPEGLNRYYSEGLNARPAASWMTKEDRLDEIADYIQFLEALRSKLSWDKNPAIQIIYIGFSQGATTLIRWLNVIHPRADYLLMWAGNIPEDLLYDESRSYFSKIKSHYFIGDRDQYRKPDDVSQLQTMIERTGMNIEVHHYSGEHKIDEEVLQVWASGLTSVMKNI